MSLSKKKSRTIVVGNSTFRWVVSPDSGYGVFVAEKENFKGRKIEVYFDTDVDSYWLEFPDVENLNLRVITPKDAASIISQALKLGWNPEERGKPLVFDLDDENLIKR